MRQVDGTEALARVRELRHFGTEAEKLLWGQLRNRRLEGFKFKRQVWIGPFIADFLCLDARLVIEADGSQHGDHADYDLRRDAILQREGYRVLRFWNNDVIERRDAVLEAIRSTLLERVPSPSHRFAAGPSLSQRERGE
jgi:very-short-patch-repair endonuclease